MSIDRILTNERERSHEQERTPAALVAALVEPTNRR
jgi:hypothetical protein